jgi:hypothetical protein
MVLLGLAIYLFARGALVMRPRETVAALSTLIAALVHSCCGADPSANDRAALEERREGDLVGDCQGSQRGERDVDPAVFDHAQVLGVKPGEFGGSLLGQVPLFSKLSKSKPQAALSTFDWLLEGRTQPDL